MAAHTYTLTVNGRRHTVETEARKLLLDVLREDIGLTGPHAGCEHGVCGACTVVLDGQTLRSCLTFGVQAAGRSILTIEGLARGDELHPLQEAFSECHGLQCGYCTPGMILTAMELLQENPSPSADEIREALSGNLCRCTGYDSIVEAVERASALMRARSVSTPISSLR
jgi:aerobic-type carbon monoxide dehydrogenase small subunit (CoxS/CutS family)